MLLMGISHCMTTGPGEILSNESPSSHYLCDTLTVSLCLPAVILFDKDAEKRAPFFHLLRRLGLVRVVKSLLGDGADASKFGLSQVRSGCKPRAPRAFKVCTPDGHLWL